MVVTAGREGKRMSQIHPFSVARSTLFWWHMEERPHHCFYGPDACPAVPVFCFLCYVILELLRVCLVNFNFYYFVTCKMIK